MAVVPGSSTKLNKITGLTAIVEITADEMQNDIILNKIMPKGWMLKFPNGKIALTDGMKMVKDLLPLIDQTLNETEKNALNLTFSGEDGAYKATEGGFVVLGEDGKMAPAELPAEIFDDEEGKIKLDALPDSVRAGVTYVATIADRDTLEDEAKRGLVFVLDATGDKTVKKGAAVYTWNLIDNPDFDAEAGESDDNPAKVEGWVKIAENESLDIDVDSLKPNYEHVQEAGAVMYDHTVLVEQNDTAEVLKFIDGAPDPEPEP